MAALVPLRTLRWPVRGDALGRLDRATGLRHRPATALTDSLSTADPVAETVREEAGSWSLEYAHADFRVYLRLSRSEERTRLDGWVVPAQALTVRLLSEAEAEADPAETVLDEFGRFEFASVPAGLARLVLTDEPPTAERPRITPPFWI